MKNSVVRVLKARWRQGLTLRCTHSWDDRIPLREDAVGNGAEEHHCTDNDERDCRLVVESMVGGP